MKNIKWTGGAISLALASTALVSCSVSDNKSGQTQSAPSNPSIPAQTWSKDAEQQLLDAIQQSPTNGLKPELFLKGDMPKDDAGRFKVLTEAAYKYASALANGYTDPTKLNEVYTIPRVKFDVRPGLTQAIQKGDVKGYLATLVPQTDEYRALGEALKQYLSLASAAGQVQSIADGAPIKPGSRDPRVAQVAAALSAGGYLGGAPAPAAAPVGAAPNGAAQPAANGAKPAAQSGAAKPAAAPAGKATTYTPAMAAAVKKLQTEFGFKADGIVGGETLDALNAGPGYRARQIAIAMERLRWLQRDPPKTRIDVNTAASVLDYWKDGQAADHRKAIVGEGSKPTPQLQAPIYRLVAKPTWTVPKGIGDKELAAKGDAYLKENGFALKDGMYVQASGPKNSLGLVKFDMQDDQQIYLHDTPAKDAFGLLDRHRSHGCVRVENAVQFAQMLAEQQGVTDQFQTAMQGEDQSFVKLKEPIPVRLLYHTAFWDGHSVQFRRDAYGWDDNLAAALSLAPGSPRKIPQPESSDVGP